MLNKLTRISTVAIASSLLKSTRHDEQFKRLKKDLDNDFGGNIPDPKTNYAQVLTECGSMQQRSRWHVREISTPGLQQLGRGRRLPRQAAAGRQTGRAQAVAAAG